MAKGRDLLSGYDASEGALFVLFMLVLAMHAESPQMLAVDNFDASLNPRLARVMTERFVELVLASPNRRQVFLTTHQPTALDGLNLADERIRLFVVQRDSRTGETAPRPLTLRTEQLKAAGEQYSLSRLWTMGRLGGLPEL